MDAIQDELAELSAEFEVLGDWEERYRYVIDLGRDLAPLSDAERSDANKVRGCASQVWLVTQPQAGPAPGLPADTVLAYDGESDSHIVQGLIAILLALTNGRTAGELVALDIAGRFDALGLKEHLTQQRSNGLASMVARIKADAQSIVGR